MQGFDHWAVWLSASAGAAPGPLAWALMVFGFGGAGLLLRFQRSAARAR